MIVREIQKVDSDGCLIEAEIEQVKKISPEQFTQIYLQDNDQFYTLSKAENNVLAVCWCDSNYYEGGDLPGNVVTYNGLLVERIKSKTNLAESSIKHAFATLVKKEMLIKGKTRGVYYLNPSYFFKGKISDRIKAIRIITTYQVE